MGVSSSEDRWLGPRRDWDRYVAATETCGENH